MAGERRLLTLGGKGFSLSSASVFEFATASPPALLKIDHSALARLSLPPLVHDLDALSPSFKFRLSLPSFLTHEEAKASILIFLYRLLLGGYSSSSVALQLSDALNNDTQTLTLDLDCNVQDDIFHMNSCWEYAAIHGMCALVDYTASSLAIVADAIAALSCEVLRVDVSTAFNIFTDSGDGFSDEDRAAVASDFKILLDGSKLRGNWHCEQVYNIPLIHGRLRSICKSVHFSTQVELNSIPLKGGGADEDLVTLLSPLACALRNLGKSSWLRAQFCLNGFVRDKLFSSLVESFHAGCPTLDSLKASFESFVAAEMNESYIKSVHEIYSLSESVRKILSWEATIAFISLEKSELVHMQENNDGGSLKSEKKDKKKKALGKGTTVLMQFMNDRLQSMTSNVIDSSVLPEKVAQGFHSLLDLKSPGFEDLLQNVKYVVDSNETRSLPELRKVQSLSSFKEDLKESLDAISDTMRTFNVYMAENIRLKQEKHQMQKEWHQEAQKVADMKLIWKNHSMEGPDIKMVEKVMQETLKKYENNL